MTAAGGVVVNVFVLTQTSSAHLMFNDIRVGGSLMYFYGQLPSPEENARTKSSSILDDQVDSRSEFEIQSPRLTNCRQSEAGCRRFIGLQEFVDVLQN